MSAVGEIDDGSTRGAVTVGGDEPVEEPAAPGQSRGVFDHALESLGAAVLAAIVLLLFGHALLRFTSDVALPWSSEIVTGLVVWLTMIGFTIGVRREDSIRVRALIRKAPERIQVLAKGVTDAVSVVVLVHLAWYAYQYVDVFGSDATPYLRLPQGFFSSAVPIGAALSAIVIVVQVRHNRATVHRWASEERE